MGAGLVDATTWPQGHNLATDGTRSEARGTTTMSAPDLPLAELEALLSKRSATVAEGIRRVVKDLRPCVRLETSRASAFPSRGRRLDRFLRRPAPTPVLPATTSKFGGRPYCEHPSELQGGPFLGQSNFAEASKSLASEGVAIPEGMPPTGLLAVDLVPGSLTGRVRWYPRPREEAAVPAVGCNVVSKYEAAIAFRGSWSLRGLEWFDAIPTDDDELWDWMNDLEVPGVDEDAYGGHKLFGHPNEALNEHDGLRPVAGRSDSIRDYALVWRIDCDKAAGLSWGTNWLYVVIHQHDLARGAFENAILTAANA
ncbi:MAG: DUF1963 domain-containing protein [Myxococcota bacterium]